MRLHWIYFREWLPKAALREDEILQTLQDAQDEELPPPRPKLETSSKRKRPTKAQTKAKDIETTKEEGQGGKRQKTRTQAGRHRFAAFLAEQRKRYSK
jgi:hypothetical protein